MCGLLKTWLQSVPEKNVSGISVSRDRRLLSPKGSLFLQLLCAAQRRGIYSVRKDELKSRILANQKQNDILK